MLYFVNGITVFQVSNFSPSNHPPPSQLLPPLPKLTEIWKMLNISNYYRTPKFTRYKLIMCRSKTFTLTRQGQGGRLFGQVVNLILNTFFSTKPTKLQLLVLPYFYLGLQFFFIITTKKEPIKKKMTIKIHAMAFLVC